MSTHTHVTHDWTKRFMFVAILLTLGLIVVFVATVPLPALELGASKLGGETVLVRGRTADAARYTAMSEYYAARNAQRGLIADAARYTAQATLVNLLRGRSADAARYTAQAELANLLRGRAADAARYTAQAAWANLLRGRAADAARYNAMAAYYAAMAGQ